MNDAPNLRIALDGQDFDDENGRLGLDSERRKSPSNVEIPNLKDQGIHAVKGNNGRAVRVHGSRAKEMTGFNGNYAQ